MLREISFIDGKKLSFKKVAYLMPQVETDHDRDVFYLQYVKFAYENDKITYTDHEYFYSMYDRLLPALSKKEAIMAIKLKDSGYNMVSDVSLSFSHYGKGLFDSTARVTERECFIHSDIADTVSWGANNFFKAVKKAINHMEKTGEGNIEFYLWNNDISREVFRLHKTSSGLLWVADRLKETVTKEAALNNIAMFLNGVMTGDLI